MQTRRNALLHRHSDHRYQKDDTRVQERLLHLRQEDCHGSVIENDQDGNCATYRNKIPEWRQDHVRGLCIWLNTNDGKRCRHSADDCYHLRGFDEQDQTYMKAMCSSQDMMRRYQGSTASSDYICSSDPSH